MHYDEVLDYFDLLTPVTLDQRSLPDNVHIIFPCGFDRSGMDSFPEYMGGAFGDYRDLVFFLLNIGSDNCRANGS